MDCPGTTAAGHAVASQVTTMTVMVVVVRLRGAKTRRQGWRWWSIPFERGLHREASDLVPNIRWGGTTLA